MLEQHNIKREDKIKNIFLGRVILLVSLFMTLSANGQSPFSRFGLGFIQERTSHEFRGMSNQGISISHKRTAISYFNPASYSSLDSGQVIFRFHVEGETRALNYEGENANLSSGSFAGFSLSFPVVKAWGVTIGYQPYSSVKYNIVSNVSFPYGKESTFSASRSFKGTGGLDATLVGVGGRISKDLAVGVNLSYLSGNFKYDKNISSSATFFHSTTENLTGEFAGFLPSIGGNYSKNLNGLLLSVGAIYQFSSKLSGSFTELARGNYRTSKTNYVDSMVSGSVKKTMNIPHLFGGGVSLASRKYTLSGEVTFQPWTNEDLALTEGDINSQGSATFTNAYKISVGGEYIIRPHTPTSYFHIIRFRGGLNYTQNYLVINDKKTYNMGVTFGVGLPIVRANSMMDFSCEIGRASLGVVSEFFLKFGLSFSLMDYWFRKQVYH